MEISKLQKWASSNIPDDRLYFKDGYWEQIAFVRDEIPELFCRDFEHYKEIQLDMDVISTHTSKSVLLPVFDVKLPDDIHLIMRYNFYNWKVSVVSKKEIIFYAGKLFKPDQRNPHYYCEGFPTGMVYGSYAENKSEFTIELSSGYYSLYTYLWLFANRNCGNQI